ncbi:transcription regulator, TetR family [Latilactobacillus sakei subsp. sakei LS25]|nr:transcription regulator, TetR family [Latilactobacillus sakei subsp. sakei LS25]
MAVGVYQIWRDWLLGGQKEPLSFIHQLLANLQHHMDLAVSQPLAD